MTAMYGTVRTGAPDSRDMRLPFSDNGNSIPNDLFYKKKQENDVLGLLTT